MPLRPHAAEKLPETEGKRLQEERARPPSAIHAFGCDGHVADALADRAKRDSDGDTEATTIGPRTPGGRAGERGQPDLPANLRIGAYRIQGIVGEGSMGVVYRAIQDNPNRVVALKVLKPGGSSADSLRRFEHEAQVLGRLQHPGIAQIFEAGTSDAGYGPQPFFAMELIEGVPLNEYADKRGLNSRERLELLVKVCEGVHHAHQKGVIHRDLKPSNIFVDQRGTPKILDFGVALATVRTTKAGVRTGKEPAAWESGGRQLVGTIPYMSFEQLKGLEAELDTRTDVYALGVITYQLLSGCLPYDLRKKTARQAVDVVAGTEPKMLGEIDKRFRGDVEIIVTKTLQGDKDSRYQSVSDFAGDIRRFLADEPITARPPSALYQLGKFTRRNKAVVVGTVAVFAALLIAVTGTGIGLARARRAEATKSAINRFLVFDILNAADPERLGKDVTIRQALDAAAQSLEEAAQSPDAGSLEDEPIVRAGVHLVLGMTYRALGEYDDAQVHLRTALREHQQLLGDGAPQTLDTVNELGLLCRDLGRYDEADSLLQAAWSDRNRLLGEDHPDTLASLHGLATLQYRRGLYKEAEHVHRQVLEARMRVLGEEHSQSLSSMNDLALALYSAGALTDAEPYFRRALDIRRRVLGDDHPDTLGSLSNMGLLLKSMGRPDEAEACYQEVVDAYKRVLGIEHATTLKSMKNLAVLLKTRGAMSEASQLYERVLEAQRLKLGDDHPDTLTTMNNMAALLLKQGELERAESLYDETVAGLREKLGQGHPLTITATYALADVLCKRERPAEAETLLLQVLDFIRRENSHEQAEISVALIRLGMHLTDRKRPHEAEPLLRESLAIRTAELPEGDWRIANAQSALGECLTQLRRFDDAEGLLVESYKVLSNKSGDSNHHQRKACQRLVDLYDAWDQPERAAEWRTKLQASKAAP